MSTVLIIVVVLLLLGAFGSAPNMGWHHLGWYPSGGLGLVLLILLILALTGRL
jgi:hypothetical protein